MTPEKPERISLIGWALHAGGIAVVVVAIAVFYKFVYCQLHERSVADYERAEQLQLLLASSSQVQRVQRPLREELSKLELEVAAIRGRLPDTFDKTAFVREVCEAADATALQVLDYRLSAPQLGPSFSSTEVSLVCTGSFASICRFLQEIDQLARVTEISKLDLASEINSDEYPFQVTFVLYYGAKSHDRKREDVL